tara:strand:+ start:39 stop:458 length:420 start_codon:yes stop_codon:yes gene_type:complete
MSDALRQAFGDRKINEKKERKLKPGFERKYPGPARPGNPIVVYEVKKGGMPTRRKSAGNYRSTKSGAGMTQKGVMAYRRQNPGSKLKTAVTGKVKAGSKSAKRRKSYCARSLGQLKRSSAKTRNDPNSRIRQARRRWKC